LARQLLAGEFSSGDTVRIDEKDGSLVFEKLAVSPNAERVSA